MEIGNRSLRKGTFAVVCRLVNVMLGEPALSLLRSLGKLISDTPNLGLAAPSRPVGIERWMHERNVVASQVPPPTSTVFTPTHWLHYTSVGSNRERKRNGHDAP